MQKEKEFEILREKLSDSNNFNEFDKNKVWNSIESKLIAKNKNKHTPFTLLRIAAILLIVIGSNLIYKRLNNKTVTTDLKPIISQTVNTIKNVPPKKDNIVVSKKDITKYNFSKNKQIKKISNEEIGGFTEDVAVVNDKSINNPPLINNSADSITAIAQNNMPSQINNKFKIIHYSDLGNKPELKYLISKDRNEYQNFVKSDDNIETKSILAFKIKIK